jgi:hypothetical protein
MNAIPDTKPTNIAFIFYLLQSASTEYDSNELCYLHGHSQQRYADCHLMVREDRAATLNTIFFKSSEFAQHPHSLAVQVSVVYPNRADFYFDALANLGDVLSDCPGCVTDGWQSVRTSQGPALDMLDVFDGF